MTPATAIAPTTRPATRIRAANGVGSSAPTTTYPTSRARVPIMVTGSPDNIWQATSTVRSAKLRTDRARRSRSTAQSNQGIHATDHDKFGKLLVEMTAPLPAKTTAPSIALAGEKYRRRKSQEPSAARGNGATTIRLKPTTAGNRTRKRRAGGRKKGVGEWGTG